MDMTSTKSISNEFYYSLLHCSNKSQHHVTF